MIAVIEIQNYSHQMLFLTESNMKKKKKPINIFMKNTYTNKHFKSKYGRNEEKKHISNIRHSAVVVVGALICSMFVSSSLISEMVLINTSNVYWSFSH